MSGRKSAEPKPGPNRWVALAGKAAAAFVVGAVIAFEFSLDGIAFEIGLAELAFAGALGLTAVVLLVGKRNRA